MKSIRRQASLLCGSLRTSIKEKEFRRGIWLKIL
jgi:hypothetical protein